MNELYDPALPPLFFYTKDSPLSHHYESPFTVNGIPFHHMEGFLMFCKAMLFGDRVIAAKIQDAWHPQAAKILGRSVANFNKEVWDRESPGYAFKGDIAKCQQNIVCYRTLMESGMRELVEAARGDKIWGIGMDAANPNLMRRELWGGNRCGIALMRARQYFAQGGL